MTVPLMIFAAGRGTRMGALTQARPKPLLTVAGRSLIDYTLDIAGDAACNPIVVNTHHHSQMVRNHLAAYPGILFSDEPDLLETGGGLRAARPLLGQGPVLTLNSDALWWGENPLRQLLAAFDPAEMDALLLLVPTETATEVGAGDFFHQNGQLTRRGDAPTAPFVYTGAQMINPDVLDDFPDGAFSLNPVWDRINASGRLRGIVHQGGWLDVGTPQALVRAEMAMLA